MSFLYHFKVRCAFLGQSVRPRYKMSTESMNLSCPPCHFSLAPFDLQDKAQTDHSLWPVQRSVLPALCWSLHSTTSYSLPQSPALPTVTPGHRPARCHYVSELTGLTAWPIPAAQLSSTPSWHPPHPCPNFVHLDGLTTSQVTLPSTAGSLLLSPLTKILCIWYGPVQMSLHV